MNLIATAHLLYLFISVAVTIWVARTLHKNGRFFLVDSFHGNEKIADSVNHLLVVGFYLINIGYVCLALKHGPRPTDISTLLEALSTKVGTVLLALGLMHFFNIYVFNRFRKRALLHTTPPPVAPDAYVTPTV